MEFSVRYVFPRHLLLVSALNELTVCAPTKPYGPRQEPSGDFSSSISRPEATCRAQLQNCIHQMVPFFGLADPKVPEVINKKIYIWINIVANQYRPVYIFFLMWRKDYD